MDFQQHGTVSWSGKVWVSVVVWALYLSACAVPAVYMDEGGYVCTGIRMGSPPGWAALLLGWMPP